MNEIEWLDKVRNNFSEEQFQKDFAKAAYEDGYVNYGLVSGLTFATPSYTISDNYSNSGYIAMDTQTIEAVYDPNTGSVSHRQIFYDDGMSQMSQLGEDRCIRSITGNMVYCQASNGDAFATNSTTWVVIP